MRSDAVINSICSSDGLALLTVEEQQREHEALNALIVWIFRSKRGVRRQRQ
jgi:hypothetical protein